MSGVPVPVGASLPSTIRKSRVSARAIVALTAAITLLGLSAVAVDSAAATTSPIANSARLARRAAALPSTIPHDCSRDVTADLLRWIRSVPNGSTLVFPPHGCFRVDGSLRISQRSGLTFEGNGSTFRAYTVGTRDRRFFWFQGGSNLVLRDLVVRGANPHGGATRAAYVPALEFQHGFTFAGVNGATLDHVQADDLYGDFVYIGPSVRGNDWSRGITIENSQFARSGRQGISIVAGQDITIEHNTIAGVARSMFDLEPNGRSGGAVNVRIDHNTTGAATNFWVDSKGAAGKIGGISVTDNDMRQATGNVIWVFAPNGTTRGPFDIERNQLMVGGKVHDEGSTGALFFANCTGITIRGNQAQFPSGTRIPAVELRNAHSVTISGNTFVNAGPTLSS